MVDGTGDSGTLGGLGGHEGRVTAEEARGPATTRTMRNSSPGSLVVSREAAPRGVRNAARAVLRTQASAVRKPASRNGEGARGADVGIKQRQRSKLTLKFMADVGCCGWFVNQGV